MTSFQPLCSKKTYMGMTLSSQRHIISWVLGLKNGTPWSYLLLKMALQVSISLFCFGSCDDVLLPCGINFVAGEPFQKGYFDTFVNMTPLLKISRLK